MNENIKDEKKSAVKAPKTRHTYVKIDRGVDLTKVKKAQALDKNRETFWKIVFRYFKKHPLITTALVVTIAISAAASVLGPKIIENLMNVLMAPAFYEQGGAKPAIDVAFKIGVHYDGSAYYTILFGAHFTWEAWAGLQGGFIVLTAIFTLISNYIGGLIGRSVEIQLRNETLEKLIKLDMSYYSDKKIGELLTKIISDTQIIGDQAQQVPVAFLNAAITFFGSLGILFSIDWKLSIVVLVDVFLVVGILFVSFGIVRKLMMKVRTVITDINGDVADRISTVRLIKSSGTEEYEVERFQEIHKEYYKKSKSQIKAQSTMITVLVAGISSIQAAVVIAAAIIYHNNPIMIATTLTSFISGVGGMIGSIMQTVRITAGLIQASTSATRIYEINKQKASIDPHYTKGGVEISEIKGDIKFEHIDFAYPEKPEQMILKDFSFNFEQGKVYAFVGETGVGKSTISKLLLRFYDATAGRVLINDKIDIKDLKLSSYLDKVGYVEQEPQILFGTVLDNVRYGKFGATDEEVMEACKKADLHELILSWPDGYDTILGERGFMLSGGQKQRLVIARMFLKDPQLLILDEATSALDNIVEKEIQGNLEKLMKGRTTITIAHRLSTIKNSDAIIVLARGVGVAQIGTFNELKDKPGHFQDLYKAGLMD
jgi:ATP-binding cassette subfamily B protein